MATPQADGGAGSGQATAVGAGVQPHGHREGGARQQRVFTNINEERLANALRWFSIRLGLGQIAAPRTIAGLLRASGAA